MNANQFVAILIHREDIELIKSVYRNENTLTEFIARQQETLEAYELALSKMEFYRHQLVDITKKMDEEVYRAYQSDSLRTEDLTQK